MIKWLLHRHIIHTWSEWKTRGRDYVALRHCTVCWKYQSKYVGP